MVIIFELTWTLTLYSFFSKQDRYCQIEDAIGILGLIRLKANYCFCLLTLWTTFMCTLIPHLVIGLTYNCCCRPTPGWLDSTDVCMLWGSWACGGGTTKGRGHCGHSKWGNSSHHLTVGSPPFIVRNCNCFCIVSKKTLPYDSTTMTVSCAFPFLLGCFALTI